MTKAQRQHRIAQLLGARRVASQTELVALLREEGIRATQATVSRDLVELGAVKFRGADGARSLRLADGATPSGSAEHVRRVLSEWVVEVAHTGSLVVVKTPPGCAHVVASALDRGSLRAALGTVAGDDTVFLAVDEKVGAPKVADELRTLAGLAPVPPGPRRRRSAATNGGR